MKVSYLVNGEEGNCCGCTACFSICPKSAIAMQPDYKGFLYPVIDHSKCIECGLCEKVCSFIRFEPQNKPVRSFAIKHKDEVERISSRSGGAFSVLTEYMLSRKGVVYGCEFDGVKHIIHAAEEAKEGTLKFKQSKYVQSEMDRCFSQCAEHLKSGREVLFSGTPCQVHGLLSYLKHAHIPTEKLLTVDLACHGVPSQKLWGEYIEFLEVKYKKAVISACFRDKGLYGGWHSHIESFVLADGTTETETYWANQFISNIMLRESCYNCPYTTPYRESDFTIADFWGIEKINPEFDDNKGISLLIAQNNRAMEIFAEIKSKLICFETDIDSTLQESLVHPTERNVISPVFWNDYQTLSKKRFYRKYFHRSIARRIAGKIYHILHR